MSAGNVTTLQGTTASFKANYESGEVTAVIQEADGHLRVYRLYTGLTVGIEKVGIPTP